MVTLKRRLYRLILRLHPASFRDRFAREMAYDFEDALATYGFGRLVFDAIRSLVLQWTAVPVFVARDADAGVPLHPLLAGQYIMIGSDTLTPFELLRGSVLFAVLFFALGLALNHPGKHILGNAQNLPVSHDGGLGSSGPAVGTGEKAAVHRHAQVVATPGYGSPSLHRRAGYGEGTAGRLRPGTHVSQATRLSWRRFLLECILVSAIVWLTSLLVRRSRSVGGKLAVAAIGFVGVCFLVSISVPAQPQPAAPAGAPSPAGSPPAAVPGFGSALPSRNFKEFDVASVKENKGNGLTQSNFPLGPGGAYVPNGGHFIATNIPLETYIYFAYKVQPNEGPALGKQLPDWVKTTRYDIEARVDGDPGKDDMRTMMQALLVERFGLKMPTEMQETPVLDLVLAKPGVLGKTLRVHAADDASCATNVEAKGMNGDAEPPKEAADGFPVACGVLLGMKPSTAGEAKLGARNVPIKALADGAIFFSGNLGKPVVDKTGLDGTYDFTLEFAPPDRGRFSAGADAAPDETEPAFLNALTAQMGLKVKADKGQAAVLVLDHVERPSAN